MATHRTCNADGAGFDSLIWLMSKTWFCKKCGKWVEWIYVPTHSSGCEKCGRIVKLVQINKL